MTMIPVYACWRGAADVTCVTDTDRAEFPIELDYTWGSGGAGRGVSDNVLVAINIFSHCWVAASHIWKGQIVWHKMIKAEVATSFAGFLIFCKRCWKVLKSGLKVVQPRWGQQQAFLVWQLTDLVCLLWAGRGGATIEALYVALQL